MQKEQPELVERLVEYQLKAKDVLAAAFFPKESDPFANMSTELKAIIMQDRKIQAFEKRLDKIENTTTLDYAQQEIIRKSVNARVVKILGGKNSLAYKNIGKKVFSAIWETYKQHFNVSSYKDTALVKYDDAKRYVVNWTPDYNLTLEIKEINQINA